MTLSFALMDEPEYLICLQCETPTYQFEFLDGKLMGSTPLSLTTVTAGEHAVRLERDGYRRWSSQVRIVASEQNRVTASLER